MVSQSTNKTKTIRVNGSNQGVNKSDNIVFIFLYTFGALDFTSDLSGVRVARSLVFFVMFCRSLFVLLSSFFTP